MTSAVNVAGSAEADALADKRWAAWVAKGVEQDRKMKTRVIVIGSAVVVAVGSWLGIDLMLR